jgi:hypothetical protein
MRRTAHLVVLAVGLLLAAHGDGVAARRSLSRSRAPRRVTSVGHNWLGYKMMRMAAKAKWIGDRQIPTEPYTRGFLSLDRRNETTLRLPVGVELTKDDFGELRKVEGKLNAKGTHVLYRIVADRYADRSQEGTYHTSDGRSFTVRGDRVTKIQRVPKVTRYLKEFEAEPLAFATGLAQKPGTPEHRLALKFDGAALAAFDRVANDGPAASRDMVHQVARMRKTISSLERSVAYGDDRELEIDRTVEVSPDGKRLVATYTRQAIEKWDEPQKPIGEVVIERNPAGVSVTVTDRRYSDRSASRLSVARTSEGGGPGGKQAWRHSVELIDFFDGEISDVTREEALGRGATTGTKIDYHRGEPVTSRSPERWSVQPDGSRQPTY